MKAIFNFLILLLLVQETKSQICDWIIRNRVDCDIIVSIYQDCNGNITVGGSKLLANGTWYRYSQDTLFSQPCDTSCIIKIRISNSKNPSSEYENDDYFCCNGPLTNCTPNDYVLIEIDKTNKRINFKKPPQCP